LTAFPYAAVSYHSALLILLKAVWMEGRRISTTLSPFFVDWGKNVHQTSGEMINDVWLRTKKKTLRFWVDLNAYVSETEKQDGECGGTLLDNAIITPPRGRGLI
jgi:hypothetical protein